MKELLDTLADIFIWWPTGNNNKKHQGKDLKGLPFREIPDLSQKKEPQQRKQTEG